MTAEGKKTTVNLRGGDRIMVTEIVSMPGYAIPSRTKKKGATALKVQNVLSARRGQRQRLVYDVIGITADGRVLHVDSNTGSQTFWLATS